MLTAWAMIAAQDKVNMSIAVLPMAADLGWTASQVGVVQSTFFYGYLLSQIPAGYFANRWSGRYVLPAGVGAWSLATAVVPLLAGTLPTLGAARAAVGFGEGVAPSAVNDLVARCMPASERARSVSTIFGGLHIGSVLGLLAGPPLLARFGWSSVFFGFGALGGLWLIGFEAVLRSPGADMGTIRRQLRPEEPAPGVARRSVPYRAFLRNRHVLALMGTHFVNNWCARLPASV